MAPRIYNHLPHTILEISDVNTYKQAKKITVEKGVLMSMNINLPILIYFRHELDIFVDIVSYFLEC